MIIKATKEKVGFFTLVLIILLLWYLGRYFGIDSDRIQNFLKPFPILISSLVYIFLYITVTFFVFFAKDVFWLAGALIFGPYLSALLISIGETANAGILFNLSRRLGRSFVQEGLTQRYKHLDEKLGKTSFFWLFVFRMAPLIPYRFMDLAAGLTSMRIKRYMIAVAVGSPLKIFWVQYIIYGIGKNILSSPLAAVQYFLNNRELFLFSFIYLVLVIGVVLKLKLKD
jgi:uncharacterized membrane protein YdjX (TVP38/TMEM64 family)